MTTLIALQAVAAGLTRARAVHPHKKNGHPRPLQIRGRLRATLRQGDEGRVVHRPHRRGRRVHVPLPPLVAVRQGDQQSNLSNAWRRDSHIQGFLGRTVKLLELGIKPVYVFDGKPPELKSKEPAGAAEEGGGRELSELEAAIASGDAEEIRKQAARTSRATPQMNADVQELLKLLGCPVVLAPSEAERLLRRARKGGQGVRDGDGGHGRPHAWELRDAQELFRHRVVALGTKKPVYELKLPTLLEQLDVTMEAFVDFCILCGCDYCGTIKGVGAATAFKLLKTHGSIEKAIASLDEGKRPTEEEMPYEEARQIFAKPEGCRRAQRDARMGNARL